MHKCLLIHIALSVLPSTGRLKRDQDEENVAYHVTLEKEKRDHSQGDLLGIVGGYAEDVSVNRK